MNGIYQISQTIKDDFLGTRSFVIIVAAHDTTTAQRHVKERVGLDPDKGDDYLTISLGPASYPLLYDQRGVKPLQQQVKILANTSYTRP